MVLRLMPYTLVAYGLSDMGLIRQNNEDVWGSTAGCLFVLADGMGGHQAGEVAAKEATQFFLSKLQEAIDGASCKITSGEEARSYIYRAIQETNRFVYKLGQTHDLLRGMGTTFCCLYFQDDFLVYAHVGDSRIYRLREQKIEQLTDDHSLLRELIQLGRVTEKQAGDFLYKNIITRAIGTEPVVEPSVEICQVRVGDTYLLCSDGLSDLLSSEEIQGVLNQQLTVEEKVRSLIAGAKRKGGYDNVTVVLVDIRESNAKEDISR
jgi:PPM family protein phosphatase